MSALDYERRFHNLSMFALYYTPSEQYKVKKLRDGLWQELGHRLIAFKFDTTIELIETVEALKACMREDQHGLGKRKDVKYTFSRHPLLKRGKGHFNQFKKREGTSVA